MSLPTRRKPRCGSTKWDAIHYALDSNDRTVRLCLILLVASISLGITLAVSAVLAPHIPALLALL